MDELPCHRYLDSPSVLQASESLKAEAQLIADVLLGDRKAIAEFVDRYSDSVFRFLSQRLDDRSSIEDLCQEVFLVAWSQLPGFQRRSSLNTWLCAIAQHKVADFYRKHIRELPLDGNEEEDGCDTAPAWPLRVHVEEDLDRRIVEEHIRVTMLQLPKGYRAILRWRYWDERPLRDVARETGRTVKSLERLLARARAEFASKWKGGQHG